MEKNDSLAAIQSFDASKQTIIKNTGRVILGVKEGVISPLLIKNVTKALTEYAKILDDALKAYYISEASKFGDKPFNYGNSEMHLTTVSTIYDYESSGDPHWKMWNDKEQEAAAQRKSRETFLRAIKEPMQSISEDGELYIIRPPNKKETEGVKCTLK